MNVDPPSVPSSLGFPSGYFIIRSLATGRLWDVSGSLTADGTMVHLWREKEQSLVEGALSRLNLPAYIHNPAYISGLRDAWADNQVSPELPCLSMIHCKSWTVG